MATLIWDKFSKEEKDQYIKFLKIFGALSGLFKDNQEGANAKKPYLYYRNHEQLFAKVFKVEDLTRKDSAFDALAVFGDNRIGIGLKTWIHSKNITYQKVAEFNKLSPTIIAPLIEEGDNFKIVREVAKLRNERIMLDKRLYKTNKEVYHYITRDDNVMNIVETSYDLIDMDSIEFIKTDGKTYSFKDKLHNYKFYKSKSVLLEEFDASKGEIIETIPIKQYDDPFELIEMITISQNSDINIPQPRDISTEDEHYTELISEHSDNIYKTVENKDGSNKVIYLPLYQDKKEGMVVTACSGVNIRHSKPKSKGSSIPRPEYEIEIRVSKWIHHIYPKFFGIDALNEEEIKNEKLNDFDLILPDGRVLRGRIKQQNGKSLQTSPQGALGKWVLNDVLGVKSRQDIITKEWLDKLAIDSLKITKIDNKHFKITVAETGAYEKFKIENKEKIITNSLIGRAPYFRSEFVKNLLEKE